MYDYSGIQATATKLVEKFGRSASLRKRTATGTSRNPSFTNDDTAIKAVFSDYNSRDINGTLIQVNDRKATIDSSVIPYKGDLIIDNSVEYSIINVVAVKPGNDSLIYKLQVRG